MKKLTKQAFMLLTCLGIAAATTSCHKDHDHYSMGNQDFVTRASSSNMLEIAAGSLAIHNSTNADVQAFGNHMVTDHGQAGTEMAALAQRKGWTIPTALLQQDQSSLDSLSALSGTAFDQKFAAMMVVSHQKTIALFQQASGDSGVPDADLRNFAKGKLPTLNDHLQEAIQLRTKVGQ